MGGGRESKGYKERRKEIRKEWMWVGKGKEGRVRKESRMKGSFKRGEGSSQKKIWLDISRRRRRSHWWRWQG